MDAPTVAAFGCLGAVVIALAGLALAVRSRTAAIRQANENESNLRYLGYAYHSAMRQLAQAQKRNKSQQAELANVSRSKGRLYRQSIEDVKGVEVRLRRAAEEVNDLAEHASERDAAARIDAIKRITQEALYGQ